MKYLNFSLILVVVLLAALFQQGVLHIAKSSRQLSVTEAFTGSLLLNSTAMVLAPGGQSTIQAILRNEQGLAMANAEIQFAATEGSIPTSAVTNSKGIAQVIFTAGNRSALSIVKASSGSVTQKLLVQVKSLARQQVPNLALTINQTELKRGEKTFLTAKVTDTTGQPLPGILITFFGSLGEIASASDMTDANGQASTSYRAGSMSGTATLTVMAQSVAQTKHILITHEEVVFMEKIFLPMIAR